jgi:uncharacterized protein
VAADGPSGAQGYEMTEVSFAGRLLMAAPHTHVAAALRDPEMLRRLIPGCTGISPVAAGRWKAEIAKEAGPITLRLTAEVALDTLIEGERYVLRAEGRSVLAGFVRLRVALMLRDQPGGTEVSHDGRLEAKGLAGRLLRGHEADVAQRSDRLLERLRDHVEGGRTRVV